MFCVRGGFNITSYFFNFQYCMTLDEVANVFISKYRDDVDCGVLDNTLSVLIRLPDFDITNGKLVHTISGLWLYMHIGIVDGLIVVRSLQATRSRQTATEYYHGYRHSHLNTYKVTDYPNWTGFCTGTGEFAMWQTKASVGATLEELDLYLMALHGFLIYEDLEGGPYIRIEHLFPTREPYQKAVLITPSDCPDVVSNLQFNQDLELIDNKHNHDLLLSLCFDYDLPICYKVHGEYVELNTHVDYTEIEPVELFMFKGERIYSEVVSDKYDFPITSLDRYINPYTFKAISNQLKNEITIKLTQQKSLNERQQREAYFDYIRTLPESDQIHVLAHL